MLHELEMMVEGVFAKSLKENEHGIKGCGHPRADVVIALTSSFIGIITVNNSM